MSYKKVLQKSLEKLITAPIGNMGNEGREKFWAITRFLTGLVILPFTG